MKTVALGATLAWLRKLAHVQHRFRFWIRWNCITHKSPPILCLGLLCTVIATIVFSIDAQKLRAWCEGAPKGTKTDVYLSDAFYVGSCAGHILFCIYIYTHTHIDGCSYIHTYILIVRDKYGSSYNYRHRYKYRPKRNVFPSPSQPASLTVSQPASHTPLPASQPT